MKWFIKK